MIKVRTRDNASQLELGLQLSDRLMVDAPISRSAAVRSKQLLPICQPIDHPIDCLAVTLYGVPASYRYDHQRRWSIRVIHYA